MRQTFLVHETSHQLIKNSSVVSGLILSNFRLQSALLKGNQICNGVARKVYPIIIFKTTDDAHKRQGFFFGQGGGGGVIQSVGMPL